MRPKEFLAHWETTRSGLLATIDKFRDEELAYAPFEGGMTAGQIMLHIAQEELGEVQYGLTRELNSWPAEFLLEDYNTIEVVKRLLGEVHERTKAYLTALDEDALDQPIEMPWSVTVMMGEAVWHILDHEIHHRGELSLILGLLGREGFDA